MTKNDMLASSSAPPELLQVQCRIRFVGNEGLITVDSSGPADALIQYNTPAAQFVPKLLRYKACNNFSFTYGSESAQLCMSVPVSTFPLFAELASCGRQVTGDVLRQDSSYVQHINGQVSSHVHGANGDDEASEVEVQFEPQCSAWGLPALLLIHAGLSVAEVLGAPDTDASLPSDALMMADFLQTSAVREKVIGWLGQALLSMVELRADSPDMLTSGVNTACYPEVVSVRIPNKSSQVAEQEGVSSDSDDDALHVLDEDIDRNTRGRYHKILQHMTSSQLDEVFEKAGVFIPIHRAVALPASLRTKWLQHASQTPTRSLCLAGRLLSRTQWRDVLECCAPLTGVETLHIIASTKCLVRGRISGWSETFPFRSLEAALASFKELKCLHLSQVPVLPADVPRIAQVFADITAPLRKLVLNFNFCDTRTAFGRDNVRMLFAAVAQIQSLEELVFPSFNVLVGKHACVVAPLLKLAKLSHVSVKNAKDVHVRVCKHGIKFVEAGTFETHSQVQAPRIAKRPLQEF